MWEKNPWRTKKVKNNQCIYHILALNNKVPIVF